MSLLRLTKMKLALLYVIAVVLSASVARSNRIRHARSVSLHHDFNTQFQELNSWRCDVPKPRLVYLDDPANDNGFVAEPNVVWIPVVAVLHRCDQSTGCCNHPTFTCKAVATQPVTKVFRRVHMLGGRNTYQRFTFTNHTRCACEEVNPRASEL